MKVVVVVLSVLALSQAQVQVRLPFINPAGVTFTGAGFGNVYSAQQQQQPQLQPQPAPQEPAQPEAPAAEEPQPIQQAEQPQPAPEEQPQPQPAPAAPQFYTAQQQQQQVYQAAAQPQQFYQAAAPAYAAYQYAQQPAAIQYQQPAAPQYHYSAAPQYHAAYNPAAVQYAAPQPVAQYHRAIVPAALPVAQYAQPALAYQPIKYAQPAVAVHQKIGYASTPVLTKVQGVADVPVTKLAYTQGYTQKEIDVAHPAVSTRKIKVRRPALRKEFYDIEHRVIVRPAGSATLELSQPISKEQQGPAVLTKTKFAHLAPVVRYGASRRIIDGEGSSAFAQIRSAPAPIPAAAPLPVARSAAPAPAPAPQQPQQAQPRQAVDQDTEVVEAARDDLPAPAQPAAEEPQAPEQQPQPIEEPAAPAQPAPAPPAPQPIPDQGRGLTITPDMPAELQSRLLELLTAKGGTVTEILNKDGTPADSASVLQVADALGDPSLQGGERITTRRIVVTRPIETIQEIEVQEPATKIQRQLFQQPTLFKHHVPAVARVPVAIPAVKHLATPIVKTTYATAPQAAYSFNYAAPHFSYSH